MIEMHTGAYKSLAQDSVQGSDSSPTSHKRAPAAGFGLLVRFALLVRRFLVWSKPRMDGRPRVIQRTSRCTASAVPGPRTHSNSPLYCCTAADTCTADSLSMNLTLREILRCRCAGGAGPSGTAGLAPAPAPSPALPDCCTTQDGQYTAQCSMVWCSTSGAGADGAQGGTTRGWGWGWNALPYEQHPGVATRTPTGQRAPRSERPLLCVPMHHPRSEARGRMLPGQAVQALLRNRRPARPQ